MNKNILKNIGVLLAGILLGWLIFGNSSAKQNGNEGEEGGTIYVCSMHPNIKSTDPKATCPLCGMDLTPMGDTGGSAIDENAVMFSQEAAALAGIETMEVSSGMANSEIRIFGKVQPSTRMQQTQSAYVAGRIEQLMVAAVGDKVRKGQTLATIYSPELYAISQELCAALSYEGAQRKVLVTAAEEKLRLLNVTEEQIREIEESGKPSPYVQLKANTSGTVTSLNVAPGAYVNQGQPMLVISDLTKVWGVFEAYERDLAFIRVGQEIQFKADAMPGEIFKARISYIDPLLDGRSRTADVRIDLANGSGRFKPEMLLTGIIEANLQQYNDEVIIPKSAVMWTGPRSVVYVLDETEELPTFVIRQVTLGPAIGDSYVITDGLAEGEIIAVNGTFVIDSAAQLQGRKSMMTQGE